MNYLKKAIWGPDPKEQHRKCKQLVRRNGRQLEKSIRELGSLEKKTESLIKGAARKEDYKTVKIYARELYGIKKQKSRLHKSKAQLDSVGMQIDESFGMLKLQENMKLSSDIMKEVNNLVKLPEITGTMRELSQELVKSGIMNEMVGDTVDMLDENEDEFEDEEVDEEVNKIVSEFTKDKFNKVENAPDSKLEVPIQPVEEEEPVEEDDEHVLNEMRERLKALQS
ncbi:hypothetical protein WICANDRAFT_63911 [Wickerhamomyces anomalus NRRL Y-366-8]|uniref:Vacuolar protein-sorting-associated protein 24 n=1 Tax=Wickerhamomyces anomalus (strain ATCC 58044 / CBS 1984 / NCYC 433 / NRRL Y-366-8) TaxID=683960 RepID=A0A1E3P3G1_WICAA|nr:uncharacterized protein WICANDRAFT_63911 [Wickerhamomyces anomalus NRRL Y-366-8]ODQ59417.1 hypothetical protein WICANDRAFT_63911 [Wickerhamomyces anomalus NRRL Y-366-8]